MKSIIFDLDLTIVDTSCLEDARQNKNWQEAYRLIPKTKLYEGMSDVLEIIRKNGIKTAIVSTSPRTYIEKIVQYYGLPVQYIIGYHDASPRKPAPAQMLKALEDMKESPSHVVSFGDRVVDIQAANAANIESVACFWGTKERNRLLHSEYSHAIIHPREILTLIR